MPLPLKSSGTVVALLIPYIIIVAVLRSHTTTQVVNTTVEVVKAAPVAVQSQPAVSTPTPTPVPTSIPEMIQATFGKDTPAALKVAKCESGMRANAISPTHDYGVFQINMAAQGWRADHNINILLTASDNIKIAKQIYKEHGDWSAWYSSYSCHHER